MKRILVAALALPLAGCSVAASEPALEFDAINLDGSEIQVVPDSPTPAPTSSENDEDGDQEQEEPEYALDRNAEIDIEDQSGDGRSVIIEEIHISGGNSFLVIYDATGLVRSSTLVTPQSQPVVVQFDLPIEKSQQLEAALYLDDGDGEFVLSKDSPILDYERELVHEDFYYTVSSSG